MKNILIIFLSAFSLSFSYGQDLISGGSNSWRFHTPDDGRTTLYIAPLINGSWAWANQTAFLNGGDVLFNGNLGLGTSTLSDRLNISGNIKFSSEYNQILWPVNSTHPYGGGITADDGNFKRLTLFHGHSIDLQTGSNTYNKDNSRLYIDAAGNIGIGTRTPDRNLDVVGGDFWQLKLSNSAEDKKMFIGWYKSRNAMEISTWGDGVFESVPLRFLPKIATFNGSVGIGTTNPDAKLTVKGKIHTQEVKVDLAGSIAPDYVFLEDYNLKTLEEVSKHISEKGHLPNIPSAKEMEKEGINLKEMNLKLLEKIEELTLYTIAQEKELKIQKEEIEDLKKLNKDFHALQLRLEKLESKK